MNKIKVKTKQLDATKKQMIWGTLENVDENDTQWTIRLDGKKFYKGDGIPLTPELVKQVTDEAERVTGKKGVYVDLNTLSIDEYDEEVNCQILCRRLETDEELEFRLVQEAEEREEYERLKAKFEND